MKIVLVTSRYPWPPRRGDQVRAVQALEALAGEHEVTLLAPEPGVGVREPKGEFGVELYSVRRRAVVGGVMRALGRGLPWQAALFDQPDLGRRLRRLAPEADLVVMQLVRLSPHLGDLGEVPVVVDLIDSLSLNAQHRARVERSWLAPAVRWEARRLARWERRMIERSRRALVVCERDRADLALRLGLTAEARERVRVLPVAVGERPGTERGEEPAPTLVFTGNLGYFVNADAISWWIERVWGELRARRPELALVVAGARPARGLRRRVAAAGGELIESPPDLAPILARATLALAPLRCGSGVPIKVLEAWAAGVPVVASPHAAAGTSGKAGEDFLVARDAAGWLRAVESLLDDPAARARLAACGRRRLAADYSAAAVTTGWRAAVAADRTQDDRDRATADR